MAVGERRIPIPLAMNTIVRYDIGVPTNVLIGVPTKLYFVGLNCGVIYEREGKARREGVGNLV